MTTVKRCIRCHVMKPLTDYDFMNDKRSPMRRKKATCRSCIDRKAEIAAVKQVPPPDARDQKHPLEEVFGRWANGHR